MAKMPGQVRAPAPTRAADEGDDETALSVNPAFASGGDDSDNLDAIMTSQKSTKYLALLSGQRRARDEADRFIKHHFKGPDGQGHNRFLDKVTFLLTVLGCVFMTYAVSSEFGRRLLPYTFLITLPVLLVIRYFQYKRRKWHYFLLDFCYWANLGCVLYMLAMPDSAIFFGLIFSIANSILPWTIISYRNSLVFHSVDRFTSFYIHAFPMAVFYAIRWYPKDVAAWWYADFNVDVEGAMEDIFDLAEAKWYHVAPLLSFGSLVVFFIQQFAEIVLINVVAKQPCAQNWLHVYVDQEYMTLFRWNVMKGEGFSYRMLNAFGPNYRLVMWMVLNMMFATFTVIPCYIWYKWKYPNLVFACYVFARATWNGANFYVEVFSRRYYARRRTIKPEVVPDDEEENQA
ncbi:Membrane transporter, putative [Hondaea fermentalgiana]|uniref:Glycerophosphocholine acyltransferase 1 n=1 Tax=Hondaea fermentalgiana TaxID=2315210 RepID=A0A2R5G3M3_9STRA|nr:Membrane transporter, putative [Hondaea fermentalgiana]|eukprot:GBG25612.1 Membrane transporter, putative [Hondaea fermentalgiana]